LPTDNLDYSGGYLDNLKYPVYWGKISKKINTVRCITTSALSMAYFIRLESDRPKA
jgi:hypothetical protein